MTQAQNHTAPRGGTQQREAGKKGGSRDPERLRKMAPEGGHATREAYGHAFYVEEGRKGGQKVKETLGTPHYQASGRKGGNALAAKRGAAHMRAIAKAGRAAQEAKAWNEAIEAAVAAVATAGSLLEADSRLKALRRGT
jgi:general stress protein YciG